MNTDNRNDETSEESENPSTPTDPVIPQPRTPLEDLGGWRYHHHKPPQRELWFTGHVRYVSGPGTEARNRRITAAVRALLEWAARQQAAEAGQEPKDGVDQ